MDWWNISVFGVIPILTVIIVFCIKRKFLWIAPIMSTILSIIISIIAIPTLLEGGEATTMFFGIAIPVHLLFVVILTVIAYAISHLIKKKHQTK